jgi:methionyl-tRNA formyltransferase
MIRAVTHPFPGAFVGDGGRRLYLWEGMVEADVATAAASTIVDVTTNRGIAVATGQGTLRLTRVQASGGREETADAWARARGLGPGDRVPTGE